MIQRLTFITDCYFCKQSTEKPLSSKQSTEQSNNIDYDAFRLFLINISSTFIPIPHLNLPLNIVKLLLNFLSNKVMCLNNSVLFLKGEEVDYEGFVCISLRTDLFGHSLIMLSQLLNNVQHFLAEINLHAVD
ncbi:hypothetical protein D917_01085 [Trichinella nativa]|uniref:Uncharacterized protein n=1 Tax=Trichinella nativa TaxID=6335 RepID=A0A1Y3EUA1_9BILA|nr:hypothetical protein D917_01085 [Trichinella nativa]